MGLFDFFKRKDKNNIQKPSIEQGPGGFNLKLKDFESNTYKATVIADVKLSPDFEKEFAHLITGKPAKAGDTIELNTLKATVKLWNKAVEISFEPGKIAKNLEAFAIKINEQLNWANANKPLFDKVIIRDLLALKNSSWLEENKPPVSEADFLNAISLTSINFLPNGGFELHYNDGDTFAGHSIIVNVTAKREIKEAEIAG